MADNYLENHHNDFLKQKARKEAARRHRQHLYLQAYRKKLEQLKQDAKGDESMLSQQAEKQQLNDKSNRE